jgi:hypothetical protein
MVAGMGIHVLVKPGIGIGILQVNDFSGLEAISSHSRSGWDSNHLFPHPKGHCGPKLSGLRIVEK